MAKQPRKKRVMTGRGRSSGIGEPVKPSPALAAIVGSDPLPRTQVVARVWEYIRGHNLQNPQNRREIVADDKLRPVLGASKTTMFELNRHLQSHMSSTHGAGGGRDD